MDKKKQQEINEKIVNVFESLKKGFSPRKMCTYVLGTTQILYPVIDKIYSQNPTVYHKCYLNGLIKNDEWRKTFSVEEEEYIIKVSGIIEKAYVDDNFENIRSLIQKGYKTVYKSFKETDFSLVDASDIGRKINKGKLSISEVQFSKNMLIVAYLGELYDTIIINKEVVESAVEIYFNNIFNTLAMEDRLYADSLKNIKHLENLFEEITGGMKLNNKSLGENIEVFLSRLHIDYATREQSKIEKEYVIRAKTGLLGLGEVPKMRKTDLAEIAMNRMESFKTVKILKVFKIMQRMFKGNTYSTLKSVALTKKDMLVILQNLFNCIEAKLIKEEEKEMCFVGSLYTYALFKVYNSLKDEVFERLKEDMFTEGQKYIEEIDFKQATIEMLTLGNRKLKADKETLQKQLREKELETTRLRKELDKRNKDREELLRLREMLKQKEQKEQIIAITTDEPTYEEKVKFIKKKKVVLFGGSEGWFDKFEEIGIKCYGMEIGNIDYGFVKGVDGIFVYSKYCDHKLVKKIKSELKSDEKDVNFLNQTNIEICVDNIYQNLR